MYDYNEMRKEILSEDHIKTTFVVRDRIKKYLKFHKTITMSTIGAFHVKVRGACDTWRTLAIADLMVEIGELVETSERGVWGQFKIYRRA